jgi:hypothetical protein
MYVTFPLMNYVIIHFATVIYRKQIKIEVAFINVYFFSFRYVSPRENITLLRRVSESTGYEVFYDIASAGC